MFYLIQTTYFQLFIAALCHPLASYVIHGGGDVFGSGMSRNPSCGTMQAGTNHAASLFLKEFLA